jgi:hypothetical protein
LNKQQILLYTIIIVNIGNCCNEAMRAKKKEFLELFNFLKIFPPYYLIKKQTPALLCYFFLAFPFLALGAAFLDTFAGAFFFTGFFAWLANMC